MSKRLFISEISQGLEDFLMKIGLIDLLAVGANYDRIPAHITLADVEFLHKIILYWIIFSNDHILMNFFFPESGIHMFLSMLTLKILKPL